MKKYGEVSGALMICMVLILSLAGITGWFSDAESQTTPQYGGTLRLGDLNSGAPYGYPVKMVGLGTAPRQVAPAIERLFRTDKTGKPVPWLVKEAKENAAAKTLTLVLRTGIKFHDGSDFDAEAVKWNLETYKTAKTAGTEKFKSIDVIDAHTVRINLDEWDNTITSSMTQVAGMMISPSAYKKNGEDWVAKNPIGTGPFRYVSGETSTKMVYKKFDGYWQKGKPYLDQIEWITIVDTQTRQAALKAGEVDGACLLDTKNAAELEKDGLIVFRTRPGSGAYGMVPDSANPKSPFADIRVRRAVQYAINNEEIVKSILRGEGEATRQFGYKANWGYNPEVVGYPYNPAKARQLLSEAGYPTGFKTKLLYRTAAEFDQVFTAVQGYLKAVDIDLELVPVDGGRYNQVIFSGGKWEGLAQNQFSPNPDLAANLLARWNGGGKFFTQMLVPDDYREAIHKAITAPDFKSKQKWTREVMKLLTDKYCLQIMLYAVNEVVATKRTVHNHAFNETPNTAQWTPEEAWLEKK
jgi:peptide/nickel transport system substrate-binding protein